MKTFSRVPSEKRFVYSPCPVCGSGRRKKRWDLGSFVFYRCLDCSLNYQYPRPVQDELVNRYDKEYFSYEIENEKVFLSLMLKSLEDVDFKVKTEEFFPGSPSFLDVGCATGMLLENMRNEGWSVKGVEVCRESAEYGRTKRGIDIVNAPFNEAAFRDESFDVIHSSHFVEHITDPADFFSEAFRVLKPGGLLVTTTPNSSSFQAAVYGKMWRSVIADHMVLFPIKTLKKVVSDSGFKILSWKTWGGVPAGSLPGFVKRPVDRLCKILGIGDVMVVMARKPEKRIL